MSAIKGKGNKTTELSLRMALVRAGVSGWNLHSVDVVGRPDFFFPQEAVAVFVDGCFWHGCSRCGHTPKTRSVFWSAKFARNKARDSEITRQLRRDGIDVIRLWEHQLKTSSGREKALETISTSLLQRAKRRK
ncbi:MAG: very short patch repair endonuclease [Edaphobacter sp.]